jgi:1-acyl-sn-glycerol-3-phosphate acyltransferase
LWNVTAAGATQVSTNKPVIFCANRLSVADPLWIMYSLPQRIRKRTFIVGGRDLLPTPLLASFAGHIIPVKKDGDVATILRTSIAVLADGNNLLVFPESGTSRTGELRKFKSGIGLLMLEVNATIVPVRVRGTMDTWPIGGLPKLITGKKATPTVTFGPEITFQGLISRNRISPYSTADQIAACVREIISEM